MIEFEFKFEFEFDYNLFYSKKKAFIININYFIKENLKGL